MISFFQGPGLTDFTLKSWLSTPFDSKIHTCALSSHLSWRWNLYIQWVVSSAIARWLIFCVVDSASIVAILVMHGGSLWCVWAEFLIQHQHTYIISLRAEAQFFISCAPRLKLDQHGSALGMFAEVCANQIFTVTAVRDTIGSCTVHSRRLVHCLFQYCKWKACLTSCSVMHCWCIKCLLICCWLCLLTCCQASLQLSYCCCDWVHGQWIDPSLWDISAYKIYELEQQASNQVRKMYCTNSGSCTWLSMCFTWMIVMSDMS